MASERVPFANPVKFGDDLELDPGAYELRRAGRPLKLERIPMELLLLLAASLDPRLVDLTHKNPAHPKPLQ